MSYTALTWRRGGRNRGETGREGGTGEAREGREGEGRGRGRGRRGGDAMRELATAILELNF